VPKKPAATAASTPSNGLSKEAQAWFNSVEERYNLDDHHRKLLTAAAIMWDRALWARDILDKDGMTYLDRFSAPRPRPEIAIERDSFNCFRQLVHELGLDADEASPNGRPPHPNSRKAAYYAGN
jgi:hypothetical protein